MSHPKDLITLSSDALNIAKEKFNQNHSIKDELLTFINEFLNNFLSEQTKRAYILDLRNFFNFLTESGQTIKNPKDIKSIHFSVYRDYLINLNYAPATVNRKLVAVRSFFKWCLSQKLIDHNPLDGIKLPKTSTTAETIAFSDQEVENLLTATDLSTGEGQLHHLTMTLLFYLGLRRSELAGIKLGHIYQERNHLVLKIRGKGDKVRFLPINNFVQEKINQYKEFYQNYYQINWQENDFLLMSKKGVKQRKGIDPSSIYRIVAKYAKKCDINKKVGAHSCRATVISHLLDTKKLSIRDVADFAGHNVITTTERYDKKRKGLDDSAAYQVFDSKKSNKVS